MRVIRSKADLDELKEDRSLVSVYVDHGYSAKNIETILNMKPAFDAHANDAWHMLIPCGEGYAVDSWMGAEGFGHQLNRQLIREYQVEEKDLPVLVFEFDPDKEYFYIALGNRGEEERINMIRSIAEMANKAKEAGPSNIIAFRNQLHEQIALYAMQEKTLRIVSRVSSRLALLIGIGAGLKGLIDVH